MSCFVLVDGPPGCGPGFYTVWCGVRLLPRYLANDPLEVPELCGLLGLTVERCPGHGPIHILVESAGLLGFTWDPLNSGGLDLDCLCCTTLAGPYQHLKSAIWDAWRSKVSLIYAEDRVFGRTDA